MSAYAVIYESGPNEEGLVTWSSYVPDLPGCISVGDTFQECEEMIREAIELHLEYSRDHGLAIPTPTSQVGVIQVAA